MPLRRFLPLALAALFAAPCPARPAKNKVSDVVKANFSSVAVIEGDVGAGTGFILREGDTTRLYTAAHVLSGNKKLTVTNADGRQFRKFGTFEVAADSDLARIELREEFDSKIALAPPATVKVDDPLFAVGNSAGAGSLTLLRGKAISLGPDVIELSNGVIQGNSGGPVFSGTTGEVVGIVTHALAAREDIWSKDTDFDEVRRFATRLDRRIKWQEMPIGRFLGEAGRIESFNHNTQLLYAIAMLDPGQAGLRLDTSFVTKGRSVLSVFRENQDVPVIAQLIDMNSKLGDASFRTSAEDLKRKFGRYYSDALRQLNHDNEPFDAAAFSGYNHDAAVQARQWRNEALRAVTRAARRMK